MTKRNLLKRIGAGLLAMLFVVGLIPPLMAYANVQNPVTEFEILSSTGVGRNYSLSMFWTRPSLPSPTNPPANYNGTMTSWNAHQASNYEIMRFHAGNALAPTGWGGWEMIAPVNSTSNIVSHTLSQSLLPGRFYAYQIRAFHWHQMTTAIPPYLVNNRVESVADPDNTVYFMSDLEVQAEGRGRDLTVSFNRPQFAGDDPFTGYRIHWQLRAGGTPHNSGVLPISAFTRQGDTYTITIENADGLIPSRVFNVWIEPVLDGADRHAAGLGLPNRPSALSDNFYDAFSVSLMHTTNLFMAENVFVSPVLDGQPIGMNYLLLYWGPPEAGRVILQQQGTGGAWFNIAVYDPPAAQSIGHLLIDRPGVETNFRIIFHDATGEAIYPPEHWTFNPTLAQFMPTRPNIVEVDDVAGPPLGLVVTWEAFMRTPFNNEERNDTANMHGNLFRDPDVVYDIWITDNAAAFQGVTPSIPPVIEGLTQEQIGTFQGSPNFTYTHTFTEFININGNRMPIVTNRVYYIRIVARRTVPLEQQSVAAYASHFIFGDIVLPPPVMPRPPLRIENSGLDYLELGWENRWVEAFEVITNTNDPRWPGVWHSAFGLRNGVLVFDYDVVAPNRTTINSGVTALHLLGDETAVRAALGSTQVPLRTQHLPHPQTRYEVHVRVLSDIIDQIQTPAGLEAFTHALHNGGGPWVTLTLDIDDITANPLTILSTLEGLESDTTYAVFFRPANPAGQAWWPTLIMGTTTSERPGMDITPPAPFLSPHQEGDRWLEFVLRPFPGDAVNYEFWISEFADRSTAWEFEPNEDFGRMFTYPGGAVSGQRRIFHADGLFPETTYYIWVRAISTTNTNNYSWSASISMTTLPLMTPPPPSGLGLAGPSEVNIINLENDLELERVASDHMVISWLPIRGYPGMPDDVHLPMEGNEDGAMGTTILGSPLISFSYMVLFPDLTPNTAYWVRARTILSVHRDGIGGEITERVDFIVQMATNPDFLDATTVFVMPDADEIQHGLHTRMTMSDWAGPMMFWTTRDDGEFDGDVIPELFPLPDRDFEINFNPYTRTLTWRFRSTDVDESGHRDNLADQRFISRLIQLRTFEYTIDMTHYNNQPVENRVIEIPYTILAAFEQRGIDFSIIAGATTYTFSPGFANTPQNTGFGVNSRLRMYISNEVEPTSLAPNRHYLTTPQSLDINVVNRVAHTNVALTALAAPVTAIHSISRAFAMDYHIGAYVQSAGDVGWRRGGGGFDEFASTVSTSTTRPTTFAAIATGIPQLYQATPQTRDALYFVNTQINFTDMEWFAPTFAVDVWQINRIIHAVARGVSYAPINMLDNLTEDEMSSLSNARMLVPGHYTVSREDALAALVRLFEVRTGRRITGAPTLQTTSFPDIANASSHLQQALLNAEFLGFIDFNSSGADPHGEMLWGDVMIILEIILRN